MNITCICGHTADYFVFATTCKNTFNCPECHTVWCRYLDGSARVLDSGFVIPPKIKIKLLPQLTLFGGNNAIL